MPAGISYNRKLRISMGMYIMLADVSSTELTVLRMRASIASVMAPRPQTPNLKYSNMLKPKP